MKASHLFLAILLAAVGLLYLDVRQLRATANFTTAVTQFVGKTEVITTNPMDYTFEVIGKGLEAADVVSYYGDEIMVADGNVPKPFATRACFRAGGVYGAPTMVKSGMVICAVSADGYYTGGSGQAEAARIMAIACQDWVNSNRKCTDWYFAPTGLNEGHVRSMFKLSRLEGWKALDNYSVIDLSVIEPGRRTMAFTKTTDVPTLVPAGYIEIELNGQPAYIQVVR